MYRRYRAGAGYLQHFLRGRQLVRGHVLGFVNYVDGARGHDAGEEVEEGVDGQTPPQLSRRHNVAKRELVDNIRAIEGYIQQARLT